MNTDPSSPSADLDDLQGERAVSAYFNDLEAANQVADVLAGASFASGTVYVIPREPGFAVTVTNPDRIPEATQILRDGGGEIRLKEKAPAASPSSALRERGPATGDTVGGGMFTPGSSAGGEGAGTASGGALF